MTFNPDNAPYPVIDPPTPILPETDNDEISARVLTLNLSNTPMVPVPVTVKEEPIPTLPDRLAAPEIPKVAAEILLVTDKESRIAAEETVKLCPTPTLPVVTNDPPTPKLPVKDKLLKVGDEAAAISWIVLTAPEETEKLVELNEATPLTVVEASIPAKVKVPPKDKGDPETEIPVPEVALMVTEEFSSSELLMDPEGKTTDPPLTKSPPDNTVPEVTVND